MKDNKTLWDLFMEDHPDFRFAVDGYLDCPCDHGYIDDDESICAKMGYNCAACWNRGVNCGRT